MTTTYADGIVAVSAAGHYRMSELLDAAAQRFADEADTAVAWPTLVGTTESGDQFVAYFELEALQPALF